VDNGYHSWSTTVPTIKTTIKKKELRFSAWLESMRKDVECTFGILKGRFRILKSGIRMSGTECADNIFLTCCALHNWLLEIDGRDVQWKEGVASDWEGESFEVANETTNVDDDTRIADVTTMDDTAVTAGADVTAENNGQLQAGEESGADLQVLADVPNAIHCLHHSMARRDGVCTTENVVDDNISDDAAEEEPPTAKTVGGITRVRMLSLDFFRSKLVTHFDIAYKRNEVKWPRRMKSRSPATNL
jgi:hypothetical protein